MSVMLLVEHGKVSSVQACSRIQKQNDTHRHKYIHFHMIQIPVQNLNSAYKRAYIHSLPGSPSLGSQAPDHTL